MGCTLFVLRVRICPSHASLTDFDLPVGWGMTIILRARQPTVFAWPDSIQPKWESRKISLRSGVVISLRRSTLDVRTALSGCGPALARIFLSGVLC